MQVENLLTMDVKKQKTPRNFRLCRSQRRVTKAPVLTLEGLWLQDLGFNIGDLVQIIPREIAFRNNITVG